VPLCQGDDGDIHVDILPMSLVQVVKMQVQSDLLPFGESVRIHQLAGGHVHLEDLVEGVDVERKQQRVPPMVCVHQDRQEHYNLVKVCNVKQVVVPPTNLLVGKSEHEYNP